MPNYSFEQYKKSYTGNANNTQEIERMATELSQNLNKLYNNIIKTGKNIDIASTISKASSGVLNFIQDPTLIEYEDRNDAEKNSQKKWQRSADDFMAFFGLGYEDQLKLDTDNVFDGIDVKKLNEQIAFLSKIYGFTYINTFVPQSNNVIEINNINTNEIQPEPVQTEQINTNVNVISDAERKLRDEYGATVSFEGNLRRFAQGLEAVHWHGAGGVSGELNALKDTIKAYFDYRKKADSPTYDPVEEERLVGEIAKAANNYIAIKRRDGVRNFSGRPNEPQWRPWSDMGKTRFESAMGIETLANSRAAVLKAANDEVRSINLNLINNDDKIDIIKTNDNNIINNEIINEDNKSELNDDNNINNIINNNEINNANENNAEEKPVEKVNENNNIIIENEPAKEENIEQIVQPKEEKVEEKPIENANENNNIINEEPAKEENIVGQNANINNNEIIIENIEKNAQPKEEKVEEKAKEPEKKEEKKQEPEKNIIIEENKNKINLPEEDKARYDNESPEQKAARIKKAKSTFNAERFKVGKLTKILMDMYDYDKLDVDSVYNQAARLISAKELAGRFDESIKFVNVSDRYDGRREKLTFDSNLYSYVFGLCKKPEKAKNLLLDPDALTNGYANYYKCVMDKKEAYDKYGEASAGGYIASAKFDIAVGDDGNTEPYRYLIVAQAMSKKTGLNSSLPASEYSKLFSDVDRKVLKETFGKLTPEVKQKILDEPELALAMYNENAKKKGLDELGAEPADPLKDKSREELKKKAGENIHPTIDEELKSLKDYMGAKKDEYMFLRDENKHELSEDLAKYTALAKMKEKLGGGDVPIAAVSEEYIKAWKDLRFNDNAFAHIREIMSYCGETGRIKAYMKNPDSFVEEYNRQTAANEELSRQFAKYGTGTVGRQISYIKYRHQSNIRDYTLNQDITDVMIYHAIGKKMGYDYQVTPEMVWNMEERFDWKLFRTVEHGYSKADEINMMNDPKALDELLDKYNDYAVNANPPRAKLEFDPLTMSTRANRYNENYNHKLLMPEDDSDPHIGDITKYQNNIRNVINEADPENMDKEDFEDAKDMIMKNTAQIIATKAIWPKRSEKSISQMNQDLRMVEPKQRESFIAKNQKQNEDCLDLSMNIYENRKDFKRMFDEAKDWKSLVDLSKKALTSSGLEITFKLREVGNKIAVEDSIAEKQQNQLNKGVKPKSIK